MEKVAPIKNKTPKAPSRRISIRKNIGNVLGNWILGRTFSPRDDEGDITHNHSEISTEDELHQSSSSIDSHDGNVTSKSKKSSRKSLVDVDVDVVLSPTPIAYKTRARTVPSKEPSKEHPSVTEVDEEQGEESSFSLAMNSSNTRLNIQRTTNFALRGLRLFSTVDNKWASEPELSTGVITRRRSQKFNTTFPNPGDKENQLPSVTASRSSSCLGGRRGSLAVTTPVTTKKVTPQSATSKGVVNRVHAGHTPCPARRRTRKSYNERLI